MVREEREVSCVWRRAGGRRRGQKHCSRFEMVHHEEDRRILKEEQAENVVEVN